jgi:hypothetical protein
MLSTVTLPRCGRWAGRMAGGVGRPQAQPRPCLAGVCWLGWRRHARSARRGQTVLRCPRRRSRWTVLAVSLDSGRTVLRCPCQIVTAPDFLVSVAGLSCVSRRTVLIVSLDTHKTVLRCPRRTVLRRRWSAKVRMWNEYRSYGTEVEEYDIHVRGIQVSGYEFGYGLERADSVWLNLEEGVVPEQTSNIRYFVG